MRFLQPSIYLTTYKGKRYIGQTIGKGNDYYGSGRRIKQLDKSKLKVQLLETTTKDKLNEREIFWIAKLKPELNYTSGGEGGDTSASFTKAGALSKSKKMKAMVRSQEWKDNIRKSKLGVKLSDFQREQMSKAHKGKKLTKEHRANISKGLMGNTNTKGKRFA